jgi:hypothetical protein
MQYELKLPTARTTAAFLTSFSLILIFVYWLFLRAMNMRFGDLFSVPWGQVLAVVASLVAGGGAIAISRVLGKPDRIRVRIDDTSISTHLLGPGNREIRPLKRVDFADIETLWLPASGNAVILKRRRKWLLHLGYSLFDRGLRSNFDNLVRDLKDRLGVQETQRRSVWWRPALGGVEYPNPLFTGREIPVEALPPVANRKFLLLWILGNSFGYLVGVAAGALATLTVLGIWILLGGDVNVESNSAAFDVGIIVAVALGALVAGFAIGTVQWRVLRRRVAAKRWAATTSLGAAGSWLLLFGAIESLERASNTAGLFSTRIDAFLVATAGLIIGLGWSGFQWLVLRRYVSSAGLWILANAASTPIAMVIGNRLNVAVTWTTEFQSASVRVLYAFVGFLGGAVLWSVLTGLVLIWLLRRSRLGDE